MIYKVVGPGKRVSGILCPESWYNGQQIITIFRQLKTHKQIVLWMAHFSSHSNHQPSIHSSAAPTKEDSHSVFGACLKVDTHPSTLLNFDPVPNTYPRRTTGSRSWNLNNRQTACFYKRIGEYVGGFRSTDEISKKHDKSLLTVYGLVMEWSRRRMFRWLFLGRNLLRCRR